MIHETIPHNGVGCHSRHIPRPNKRALYGPFFIARSGLVISGECLSWKAMGGNIKILRLKNMIKEIKIQQPLVDMKPCESPWKHTLNIQKLDNKKNENWKKLRSDTLSSLASWSEKSYSPRLSISQCPSLSDFCSKSSPTLETQVSFTYPLPNKGNKHIARVKENHLQKSGWQKDMLVHRKEFIKPQKTLQGGPLPPVINGVVTPTSQVITPLAHL